jgi:hypothetical protein
MELYALESYHANRARWQDQQISAAKMIAYAGDPEEYFTFITPEAYQALTGWMKLRKIQEKTLQPTAGSCVTCSIQLT